MTKPQDQVASREPRDVVVSVTWTPHFEHVRNPDVEQAVDPYPENQLGSCKIGFPISIYHSAAKTKFVQVAKQIC